MYIHHTIIANDNRNIASIRHIKEYARFVGISAYMINAIGVLIDLVFLAIFSILLYHMLSHVRTAKIVINFIPIVKDFSPKLRKMTIFSEDG